MRSASFGLGNNLATAVAVLVTLGTVFHSCATAGEPDPKSYWDVGQIRPGMKGVGQTVNGRHEARGVWGRGLKRDADDVSPGRDMVLCRLTGCNLEHAGIIQGMSGSPIYIDGKLLGAVAFAWEFAKDPIAGVTPFSQMCQYVRSNDQRRIAAESKSQAGGKFHAASFGVPLVIDGRMADGSTRETTLIVATDHRLWRWNRGNDADHHAVGGIGVWSARTELAERSAPSPGYGTDVGWCRTPKRVVPGKRGPATGAPGSPLSIAMVMGDFDLSGIGTVTHVEGDRVYGFGHPMFSLGACEFPMMTGYIHTVYPRASVSMKMGSPLKVVGVIDTDVSTSVAGRIGLKPDMLPLSVRVKTSQFADAHTYRVQMSPRAGTLAQPDHGSPHQRDRHRCGNLPEELTRSVDRDHPHKGV